MINSDRMLVKRENRYEFNYLVKKVYFTVLKEINVAKFASQFHEFLSSQNVVPNFALAEFKKMRTRCCTDRIMIGLQVFMESSVKSIHNVEEREFFFHLKKS